MTTGRMVLNVREFLDSLREGPYTSVGAYPKFWILAGGYVLSYQACLDNALTIARSIRRHIARPGYDEWTVRYVAVNWEDAALYCDATGERIESAYAEEAVE